MQAMPSRLHQPDLRGLLIRLRPLLRAARGYYPARQSQSQRHAGSHSPVQDQPAQVRDRWFADRAHLGTPISDEELRHGVRAGIIAATLLRG